MTEAWERAFDRLEAECSAAHAVACATCNAEDAEKYFEVQWRLWELLGRPTLAEFVNVAANAGKSDGAIAGELGVKVEDVRLARRR
jgi:ribonuclease I